MSRKFNINTAKIQGKKMVYAIGIIAMLAVASMMLTVPTVKATAYPDRTVGAYIATSPKLVGIGQEMTCNLMVWPALEGPTFWAPSQLVSTNRGGFGTLTPEQQIKFSYENAGYANLTVTFTRPDGTKDSFMPQDTTLTNLNFTDPGLTNNMGTLLFYYKPNMAGNWSATFTFPGETLYNNIYSTLNDTVYYKPATSPTSYFMVQDAPVNAGILNGWPFSPLPTSYWERPISISNREWANIGGNFPDNYPDGINYKYNMYSDAPTTAHIVAKEHLGYGGIVGGMWGSNSYNSKVVALGAPYIWDGKVYVNEPNGQYFNCYDLRTGQTLWRSSGSVSSIIALKPYFQTPGQTAGAENTVQPYIFDTTTSGQWLFRDVNGPNKIIRTITGVPSGLADYVWVQGSYILYMTQKPGQAQWNKTVPLGFDYERVVKWDLTNIDASTSSGVWSQGLVWNTTVARAKGEVLPGDEVRSGLGRFDGAGDNGTVVFGSVMQNKLIGYDMSTGKEIYRKTYDFIGTNYFYAYEKNILLEMDTAIHAYHAIDAATGKELWVSEPIMADYPDWSGMASYYEFIIANGNFYVGSYDGRVYAISLTDGHIVWRSDPAGGDTSETIYGRWVFAGSASQAGAGGKLYFATGIVYGAEPLSRYNSLVCLDEMTGQTLWTIPITGAQNGGAIADGYYVLVSEDGNYYTFGKGKTETTISMQNDVIAKNNSVLIKGTVLDMSPAAPGVAAVADSAQTDWMNYLHLQNATIFNEANQTAQPGLMFNPPTPKGVDVKLWTIDPNGNKVDIGTTTTDSNGMFHKLWTPTIEGEYTLYATFAGSQSYWDSQGVTALAVTAAVAPTSAPGQGTTTNADNSMLLYAILVAVIIAIVVGLVAILRKH